MKTISLDASVSRGPIGRAFLQLLLITAAGVAALVIWQRFLRPTEPAGLEQARPALGTSGRPDADPRSQPARVVVIRETAAPTAQPVDPEPEEPMEEEGSFGQALSEDEMRPALEATLSREPKDQAWARDAERDLSAKVGDALPEGSRVIEVHCQSSMCRMRLDHQAASAHDGLVRLLPAIRPWNGPIYIAPPTLSDGAVESDVFIAREGYPLEGIAE